MKSNIQNIIKTIVFLVVFGVGLAGLYNVFKWKDTNGDYLSTFDSLYSLERDKVDVVFAGPSYTYHSMNPAQLWRDYGIASFTMSISGQDKNSTVASIREVLKTQSPEVVMIDVSGTLFDEHAVQGNVYRNTISMRFSANSAKLVMDSVDKEEQLDYLLRWPIIHTRYKELKRYDFVQYKPSVYSMGFNYVYRVESREKSMDAYLIEESFEISEKNKAWIDDLYELSQKHNFELVFYLTPGVGEGDYRRTINGVEKYLDEKGISFLDLDKTTLVGELDYSKDFYDYRHLNYYGSVKQCEYIAEYLKNNFNVADHRNESGYSAWERVVYYGNHVVMGNAIATDNTNDADAPVRIAQTVSEYSDLIVVVAVEGDFMQASSNISGTLEALGISVADYSAGGSWVIEDGAVTYTFAGTEKYRIKVNNADTMEVSRIIGSLDTYVTNVTMGTNYYRNTVYNVNGMYLFIYDKVTETVICNGFYY